MPSAKPNADCPAARLAAVPGAAPVVGAARPLRRAARALGAFATAVSLPAVRVRAWTPALAAAWLVMLATATVADADSAATSVTLSVSPSSVVEDAGSTSVTVTATANAAVAVNTPVTVTIGGGTATSGTDYAAVSDFTITIAANATSGTGTFTLTPTQDTAVEGGETIGVSGTSTSTTVTGTTVALNDHGDSGWRNSLAAGPFVPTAPPATPGSVTVTRADGTLTASWHAVDGATGYWITYSSDGGASWSLAALNHAETSITVSPATNGATYLVGVRARSDHGDSGWRNSPAAGPFVRPAALAIGDAEAEEGDALSFTVTLDSAVPGGFTVAPSFIDGTATGGTDYTANTNPLSFSGRAGETQTVVVATTEDAGVEEDETFTVGLAVSGTAHDVAAGDTATGTITDNDQGEVSSTLTIGDASASEGDKMSFTVTLGKAVPGGLTVTPTFRDGVTVPGKDYSYLTATRGKDYRAGTLTLDFAGTAGEAVTFTVPTIEDQKTEYPEVFTVGLSVSGTSHRVTATDTATGIIYDDDAAATSGGATASSSQIKDNGSSITIYSPKDPVLGRMEYQCTIPKRVTETADTSLRFKHFQIACGARPGAIRAGAVAEFWSSGSATATKGSSGDWDYEFFNQKTKFWPGDKSIQRLGFRINDDELTEGPEYFQFSLKWTTKVGLGWLGIWLTLNESVHTVTVWIDDDDEYNLSVAPASVTEAGGAKTVTVTASVADDAVLAEARTLNIQVGKSGDLAVEGTDYRNVGNFDVTIPKGSNKGTGTFTLTPVVDAHLEPNERITVAGSGKSDINGKVLRPRVNSAALWLSDSSVVALSASPAVNEGGGSQTVTVTATSTGTAQRATPVTVSVGKSGDAAVEGTDYQAVSDFTVTIPSGSKTGTGTFSITPINDTAVEDDETITLSGTIPGGTVTDGSLTLLDNDVTLALSPASTGEEAGAKTVTVTARAKTARTAARALTVSVGKVGDSAEAGTDYGTVADFSLTIPANQVSGTATFTFTPRDDKIIEGREALTVHGTGTGLDVGRATLTITETDTTDFVISLNPNPVAEGVNWRNLVVTISTTDGYTVSQKVTCRFQNGGGSATWGSDYYIYYSNVTAHPVVRLFIRCLG